MTDALPGQYAPLTVQDEDEERTNKPKTGVEGAHGGAAVGGAHGHAHDDSKMGTLKTLLRLATPVFISYFLQTGLYIECLMFAGRMGETVLAGCALAVTFCNVTGFSIGVGLAEALDTLCSQAFGAGNRPLVGIHLQRGLLILLTVSVPIIAVWIFAGEFLPLLGLSQEISDVASLFARALIPMLPLNYAYEVLKKFLCAQELMMPILWFTVIGNIVNVGCMALFVLVFDWGFVGIPLAMDCAYVAMPLALIAYVVYYKLHEGVWLGWKREALKEWMVFLRLGVPSMLMICFEWWAFEICALLAGLLGATALASHSVLMNTAATMYMLPLGISIATSNHIGNQLGAGQWQAARRTAATAASVQFVGYIFLAIFMLVAHNVWPKVYTNEPEVISMVAQLIPLLVFYQFFDGYQCVLSGVLRGCGRQKLGAIGNFVGYYLLGLPVAGITAILLHDKLGWGLRGLWYGLMIGAGSSTITFGTLVIRMPWVEMSEQAQRRSGVAVPVLTEENEDDPEAARQRDGGFVPLLAPTAAGGTTGGSGEGSGDGDIGDGSLALGDQEMVEVGVI